jgi:hypothetical protein
MPEEPRPDGERVLELFLAWLEGEEQARRSRSRSSARGTPR